MEAFPQVRLVIDAKEQRIQRPKTPKGGSGQNTQKPYDSGKKKAHTLKSQIAVQPNGHIEAVSESVPGGANHDLNLLRQSKLLDQLDADEEAMLDKGYDGIQNDYPNMRLTLGNLILAQFSHFFRLPAIAVLLPCIREYNGHQSNNITLTRTSNCGCHQQREGASGWKFLQKNRDENHLRA